MVIGIGIVGMPGSGKSILSDAARSLGIPVIIMGDAVREETRRRGLELTAKNVLMVAQDLRKKYGRKAVAVLVVKEIENKNIANKNSVVVIEGLRSPEERDVFDDFFDVFYLVAVHASPRTRYKRILERRRLDDAESIRMLKERDRKELEFGIGELLALADVHLVNEGKTKEDFFDECKSAIKKIIDVVNVDSD